MQTVIVFDDVVSQVREESLRDLADRFEGNHLIPRPVDEDRWNRNRFEVGTGSEGREGQSRGKQDQFANLSCMIQRMDRSHESAEGRADDPPIRFVRKDRFELTHPFLERAFEIGREHSGKPFAELARFAAVAVAFEAVKVDEAACVHVLSFRVFLRLEDDNLRQRADDEDARNGKRFGDAEKRQDAVNEIGAD